MAHTPDHASTFEGHLTENLVQCGMFDRQAKEVIEKAKADPAGDMIPWSSPLDGYPEMVTEMAWIVVKDNALKWIDANLPKAWHRPMFESKPV